MCVFCKNKNKVRINLRKMKIHLLIWCVIKRALLFRSKICFLPFLYCYFIFLIGTVDFIKWRYWLLFFVVYYPPFSFFCLVIYFYLPGDFYFILFFWIFFSKESKKRTSLLMQFNINFSLLSLSLFFCVRKRWHVTKKTRGGLVECLSKWPSPTFWSHLVHVTKVHCRWKLFYLVLLTINLVCHRSVPQRFNASLS